MPRRHVVRAVARPPFSRSCAMSVLVVLAVEIATPVEAATLLDPSNPGANFQTDGAQPFTTAPGLLTLQDASKSDFINFFAFDNDAAAGKTLDVVATFRVIGGAPASVNAGNRVVINDVLDKSLIAQCVQLNNYENGIVNGIGLYSSGSPFDASSYPVFVPAEWFQTPLTIRVRRWANGDGEIMEINGVAPSPRALLTADLAPPVTRAGASVEFGSGSAAAECSVEYTAFRSELVVPEPSGAVAGAVAMLAMLPALRRWRDGSAGAFCRLTSRCS